MMLEIPVWVLLALCGGVGQLLRSAQGVYKAIQRGEKIKWSRVFWTWVYSLLAGAMIGYFYPDYRAAFLAGYAATDFTEGLVKAISRKAEPEEEVEEEEK
ncbi:MAG: hypothetical protein ACXQTW_00260 [Candidatus Methanospirareceae archaeon]